MEENLQASAQHRPRVLIMDEDKTLRRQVADAVRSDCDVVEAENTDVVFATLAATDGTFDVVFACCVQPREMPQFAATVRLVRELFRRWPAVSVVIVAAASEAERLRGEVLLSGVRGVVRTPFVAAEVTDMIERVVRQHPVRRAPSSHNVAAIRRTLDFLEGHVTDVPALRELAVMAAMSRSHFSRTFHAVVGMPLRDYVRDLRLKRAHELLLSARLSLTSIAAESGFYDLPHFDKAFRHRLGLSPQQFRARYAAPAIPA
jgi:AraC-like DNA-binding protein